MIEMKRNDPIDRRRTLTTVAIVLAVAIGCLCPWLIAQAHAAPQKVTIGVFLKNIESIDVSDNTYYLDFILWMKWKGSIDPTKSFKLRNVMDVWGITLDALDEKPRVLPDGTKYQRWHVEGKFYHKFWLGTYPIDWQKITFELTDRKHTADKLVYVADKTSRLDPDLAIPGWRIVEVYNYVKNITIPNTLGLPVKGTSTTLDFSRYRFGVRVYRPAKFFFLKIMPPIMLVILCSFLIFFLKVEYIDARFSTVIGTLLTAVFLQLAFSDPLPNIGVMTLMDQLFNICYLTLFLILVECIVVTRWFDRITEIGETTEDLEDAEEKKSLEDEAAVLQHRIDRIEGKCRWLFPLGFLVACLSVAIAMRGWDLFAVLFYVG